MYLRSTNVLYADACDSIEVSPEPAMITLVCPCCCPMLFSMVVRIWFCVARIALVFAMFVAEETLMFIAVFAMSLLEKSAVSPSELTPSFPAAYPRRLLEFCVFFWVGMITSSPSSPAILGVSTTPPFAWKSPAIEPKSDPHAIPPDCLVSLGFSVALLPENSPFVPLSTVPAILARAFHWTYQVTLLLS